MRWSVGMKWRDTRVAETNVQNDWVSNFICADAVVDAFGVENERANAKVLEPRHITDAVLLWVDGIVQNSI